MDSFTQRVINLRNSLPLYIVNSVSVNSFKTNTDKFGCSQDVNYDYKCDIAGTGNRSDSNSVLSMLIKKSKKRTQKWKPVSDTPI